MKTVNLDPEAIDKSRVESKVYTTSLTGVRDCLSENFTVRGSYRLTACSRHTLPPLLVSLPQQSSPAVKYSHPLRPDSQPALQPQSVGFPFHVAPTLHFAVRPRRSFVPFAATFRARPAHVHDLLRLDTCSCCSAPAHLRLARSGSPPALRRSSNLLPSVAAPQPVPHPSVRSK